ncbi:MAG: TetR/AcrR family transcriptional regulator [Acidimicrobiia bacterium]|nr:TetR/AcrR family transcriptional regulator [Acidimicrobiia bacterium]
MTLDRPAAIRRALRNLVAERGFHGASMGAVAKEAGVATGTAYVHYESKEELVYATYLEIKAELSAAVLADFDQAAKPFEAWRHILTTAYEYLAEEPERARFLTQLEESPYYEEAHARLMALGDPLYDAAKAEEIAELLVPLPTEVIYALSFGVAVRLIAAGVQLKTEEVDLLVDATWRAVTKPE